MGDAGVTRSVIDPSIFVLVHARAKREGICPKDGAAMVKATAKLADGRVLIVIGISAANVGRLQHGDPIYFDPAALRIAPGTTIGAITLFYGADEAELTRTLRTLIGPDTDVIVVPHGDGKPQ